MFGHGDCYSHGTVSDVVARGCTIATIKFFPRISVVSIFHHSWPSNLFTFFTLVAATLLEMVVEVNFKRSCCIQQGSKYNWFYA